MEGMNHGGNGAARPQHSGLPFFGLDSDSQMMSDDLSLSSPFSPTTSNNNDNFLQDPIFPEWKTGAPRGGDNPDDLQKQDPLAAQIWRLYTRTKSQLPNQERMENLTWRMMAMSLKRKEREQLAQQARYVLPHIPHPFSSSRRNNNLPSPALLFSPLFCSSPFRAKDQVGRIYLSRPQRRTSKPAAGR